MAEEAIIGGQGGVSFEDTPDQGRVLLFGHDTDGRYGLMEWTVAARPIEKTTSDRTFQPHQHADVEETFIIRSGHLEFLIGETVTTVRAGDVIRIRPGTRHGYFNNSGHDVEMLVVFSPGGFEGLFVKYRTDQPESNGDGFEADAKRLFATEFEH
jgi:mannose-6-phosphate isomerase-like protein (cupin superfamily)